MSAPTEKLPFAEKVGYGAADAAANFVFMSMVLFQTNFYTDVFKLSATAAAAILLWPRLWDAVADPIVGILADRTNTRWGKFRPWILFTTVPWFFIMIAAYTVPTGWETKSLIIYAAVTNTLLMTIYSMNNMPYAALGGVMTADVNERASLNSYRFVLVNIAQFMVGGFTLSLKDRFAEGHDAAYGWRMTMTVWAVLCFVLFLITFFSTKERIQPVTRQKNSIGQDFADLFANHPWWIMFGMTLVHFAILSGRGGAMYNYYAHFADKTALFDWLHSLGLTAAPLAAGDVKTGLLDGWLGYVVHANRDNLVGSNVVSVANGIMNMAGTGTTIVIILLSQYFGLAKTFGKKTVAVTGFALATVVWAAFYLVAPTNIWGMFGTTVIGAIVYAPTIALVWAIYADVADHSEWKTGRRATGMVFATIGFALKSGLALGSAGFLWIMAGFFHYDTQGSPEFVAGDANHIASLANVPSLASKLKAASEPVSVYVRDHLASDTQQALAAFQDTPATRSALETLFIRDLNKVIAGPSIYDAARFTGVELRENTKEDIKREKPSTYELTRLNRLLLEDAYASTKAAEKDQPAKKVSGEIAWQHNQSNEAKQGFHVTGNLVVSLLFAMCTLLLALYPLGKSLTLQMAEELAERRRKLAAT